MIPRTVARVQGLFNLVGGAWLLLHLRSFERVFGPRTDRWLRYTSGGLLATTGWTPDGGAEAVRSRRAGVGSAATLVSVDLIHVPLGRLRPTYLLDAAVQAGWLAARAACGRLTPGNANERAGGVPVHRNRPAQRSAAVPSPADSGLKDDATMTRTHPGTATDHSARTIDPDLLGIYLNDHLAGATSGTERVRYLARATAGSPLGREIGPLAAEIAEDRKTLLAIMRNLGVPVRRYKVGAAWIAERAGRLKTNGRLVRRSPLTTFFELEMLRMAVEGKAAGWQTLRRLAPDHDALDARLLDDLLERARSQQQTLEQWRERRIRSTFERPGPATADSP
ncbi:hypothetical protein ACIRPE_19000 [Kitasatospora aureofaciens]|nr:hypothetical protein [Kitasatospora aureofaciens]